jgi:hypothetical protein
MDGIAKIRTASPLNGWVKWTAIDIDETDHLALIEVRFSCAGLEIACSDWFSGDSICEFRRSLTAFARVQSVGCELRGQESNLLCRLDSNSSGVYFSFSFRSVVPVDTALVKLGLPHGTNAESSGIKLESDLTILCSLIDQVACAVCRC